MAFSPDSTDGRDAPALDVAACLRREGAEVVVLLTEGALSREVDPDVLGAVVASRKVVDGRHALDPVRRRSTRSAALTASPGHAVARARSTGAVRRSLPLDGRGLSRG